MLSFELKFVFKSSITESALLSNMILQKEPFRLIFFYPFCILFSDFTYNQVNFFLQNYEYKERER